MSAARFFVDAAVGSREFEQPLLNLGLPVSLQHLDFGDFAFSGRGANGCEVRIGIEFKKLAECVGSMRTERLQGHQVPGCLQRYDYTWLLVEGLPWADAAGYLRGKFGQPLSGRMTMDEFTKRMLSLSVPVAKHFRHLYVVYTHNREDTLRFLTTLYRWWTDADLDAHKSHVAYYDPPLFVEISHFRKMVMKLPGVGMELSERIEQFFSGDLVKLLLAAEPDWCKIEGVGPKTAAGLVNITRKLRNV